MAAISSNTTIQANPVAAPPTALAPTAAAAVITRSSISPSQSLVDNLSQRIRALTEEIRAIRPTIREEAEGIKQRIDWQNPSHHPLMNIYSRLMTFLRPRPTFCEEIKLLCKMLAKLALFVARGLLSCLTCFCYPLPKIPTEMREDWVSPPSNPRPLNVEETRTRLTLMLNTLTAFNDRARLIYEEAEGHQLLNHPVIIADFNRLRERN